MARSTVTRRAGRRTQLCCLATGSLCLHPSTRSVFLEGQDLGQLIQGLRHSFPPIGERAGTSKISRPLRLHSAELAQASLQHRINTHHAVFSHLGHDNDPARSYQLPRSTDKHVLGRIRQACGGTRHLSQSGQSVELDDCPFVLGLRLFALQPTGLSSPWDAAPLQRRGAVGRVGRRDTPRSAGHACELGRGLAWRPGGRSSARSRQRQRDDPALRPCRRRPGR